MTSTNYQCHLQTVEVGPSRLKELEWLSPVKCYINFESSRYSRCDKSQNVTKVGILLLKLLRD
jgi:hypothetical protein